MKALALIAIIGLIGLSASSLYHEAQQVSRPPTPAELPPPTSSEALATLRLPLESQRALGVECTPAQLVDASEGIVVAGEVLVPPGRDIVLSAPTAGRVEAQVLPQAGEQVRAGQLLLSLVPMAAVDRGAKASAERDLDAARANAEPAAARVERATVMQKAGSGSLRSVEDARAQHRVAQAEVRAAESRLRTLERGVLDVDVALAVRSPVDGVIRAVRVASAQAVPAGAPLIDVSGTGRWVRASFTLGEAYAVDERQQALARRVGGDDTQPLALVLAPPSADPLRGSVDRFFALPSSSDWTPGERVLVELSTRVTKRVLTIPASAVVRDAEGAAWIYEQTSQEAFRRRRVEPSRRVGDQLLIARGLVPDSRVVSVGAIELWGFDLGADR